MTVRWLPVEVLVNSGQLGRVPIVDSKLRALLHDLWDEHVALTRMAIISFAAGLPDLPVVQARLMKNQETIGNALATVISLPTAAELTRLLKEHIAQAVDVLKAAKAGNAAALEEAQRTWKINANQIADLLAPPLRLPAGDVRAMMQRHLETTTAEAVARLKGDWVADLAAYDAARQHMLHFADVMASRLA